MKSITQFSLFSLLILTMSSCDLAEGIFKLGFNSAIFLVVIVLVVIIWIFVRARRRG